MADRHRGQPGQRQAVLDQRAADGLSWARWAVGRWSEFPVGDTPRPLVLVGPRVRAAAGFATSEAKQAFIEGVLDLKVDVPARVLRALGRRDIQVGSRVQHPLTIIAAERAQTEFMTDRGSQRLPSWRLTAEDALGPIWVLDPDLGDWRPAARAGGHPPDLPSPGQDPGARVQVGADDRSLLVDWLGAVPEFERYATSTVIESPTAFAVVAIGEDVGPPGHRTLAGRVHRVPGVLQQPVGARVFVDLHGNAGQVVPLEVGDEG